MTKYDDFIDGIIASRGRFACGEEYHERHHIKPKCLGGTNDEENLVDLYPREHYEAHRLLALEHPEENGLTYAWFMMSNCTDAKTNKRCKVSAEEYEEARIAVSKLSISEETRKKMSDAKKANPIPPEVRKKMADTMRGRHLPEEWRRNIGNGNRGKPHPHKCGWVPSDETRAIWSEQRKGRDAGGNNPNAKRVYCDGIVFDCAKDCAEHYGIAATTLRSWMNGQRKIPEKWTALGLRYVEEAIA